jgi:hypothetical protein
MQSVAKRGDFNIKTTLNRSLLLFVLILSVTDCGWSFSARSSVMETISKGDIERAYGEWGKFRKKELAPGFLVTWPIKITEISAFGGFYVKGHLYKNKSCPMHLIWDPNDENVKIVKQKFNEGDTAIVNGILEGTSETGEVILSVKNMKIAATTN